ncbi:MAG: helix-turn-helix domain-containing protein [Actinomycetota bacterium]|nr:helix-turn-helix domain-containing protein [Actinomycetota bacterium]
MHAPAVVHEIETTTQRSPLAAARVQRKLTIDETAKRAGLTPEQVQWLEEGRVYRFPSTDAAIAAAVMYATALEIDQREARGLAGVPTPSITQHPATRVVAAAAAGALLVALAFTVLPGLGKSSAKTAAAHLPPPWRISVDTLNGGGDINCTRRIASRVGSLGYRLMRVAKANRFDYPLTAVYFEPGGEKIGARLADQLGVDSKPLPGGNNPLRLVVVVGQACGP